MFKNVQVQELANTARGAGEGGISGRWMLRIALMADVENFPSGTEATYSIFTASSRLGAPGEGRGLPARPDRKTRNGFPTRDRKSPHMGSRSALRLRECLPTRVILDQAGMPV